jgi:hypothetical protein
MYHNDSDGDQNPVAILWSAQPPIPIIAIKFMLTKAGDPCGSSAPEFAPSLLVMWKLSQSSQHNRRTFRKLTLKWLQR